MGMGMGMEIIFPYMSIYYEQQINQSVRNKAINPLQSLKHSLKWKLNIKIYKKLWGGLKRFFSRDKPLQTNLELAFFLPQGLFFSFLYKVQHYGCSKTKNKD
jgi:hypothetical protein